MRAFHRLPIALAYLLFFLGSPLVLGGDGLTITINNDSSDNLLVTVYDRSATPPQQVMSRTPIYGNASLTVSIAIDSSGHGQLSWTAMTADHDMRQCGHGAKANLNDGDTVNVHADSDCTN
jgi:hypothetical protein